MRPTGRFRRSDRLLDSRDFRRVSRRGKRSASEYFVVLRAVPWPASSEQDADRSRAGRFDGARLGVTVSRKVGNSVARNYIKRSIREWFRTSRDELCACDLVVIAKPAAATLRDRAFAAELDALVRASKHGLRS